MDTYMDFVRILGDSQRTLVSTFAGRTMPTHDQNLQKSFQVPTHGEREIKNAPLTSGKIENMNR